MTSRSSPGSPRAQLGPLRASRPTPRCPDRRRPPQRLRTHQRPSAGQQLARHRLHDRAPGTGSDIRTGLPLAVVPMPGVPLSARRCGLRGSSAARSCSHLTSRMTEPLPPSPPSGQPKWLELFTLNRGNAITAVTACRAARHAIHEVCHWCPDDEIECWRGRLSATPDASCARVSGRDRRNADNL